MKDETGAHPNAFGRFLAANPLASVALIYSAYFAATVYRLLPSYGSIESMILNNGWNDAQSFYRIMTEGYSNLPIVESRVLFLYPFTCRIVALLTGEVYALGVVAFGCSLLCCLALYRIFQVDWGLSAGESLGGTLFFIFLRTPESVYLIPAATLPPTEMLVAIVGTEPLYLLLALLSYRLMVRERYLPSALLLAFATVTRLSGCLIALGAFAYLIHRRNWNGLFYLLSPLALLIHFAYYGLVFGNLSAFFVGSTEYYQSGFLAYPFYDLVQHVRSWIAPGDFRWSSLFCFEFLQQYYCIPGLILLFRRNRLLFWLTLPPYLLTVSLRGWSDLPRYYVVLWGINAAYYLTIVDWIKAWSARKPAPRVS